MFYRCTGGLRALSISPGAREEAFEGIGFDGSNVDGFALQEQSDLLAFLTLIRSRFSPWKTDDGVVANVFCVTPDSTSRGLYGDPMSLVLRNALSRQKILATLQMLVLSLSIFILVSGTEPKPIDQAGYL